MLARRLDVTMRTAQRHLAELEEEGYVSVDRGKKPFEYSINWEKTWPHLAWLRVILFHPEVRDSFQGLSDIAYRTYELARQGDQDPSEALRTLYAQSAKETGVA
jgi:DNA-binding transcriptional ArsR family regulator